MKPISSFLLIAFLLIALAMGSSSCDPEADDMTMPPIDTTDNPITGTCSNGEAGNFTFTVDGETHNMTVNQNTVFFIAEADTASLKFNTLFASWAPTGLTGDVYAVNSNFLGDGLQAGDNIHLTDSEDTSSTFAVLSMSRINTTTGMSEVYASIDANLTIHTAEQNAFTRIFTPIEATFSGLFSRVLINATTGEEIEDTITIEGSFCLWGVISG